MGLIAKSIEGIIVLGLAAGAVLYGHSTYIAATNQNEIPAPFAAFSKAKKDTRDVINTGKEIADYFAGDVDEEGIVKQMEAYSLKNEQTTPSDDKKYLPD